MEEGSAGGKLFLACRGGEVEEGEVRRKREGMQGWWSSGRKTGVSGSAPVVHHPCLHEGYDAMYKRVHSGGLPPDPPEVQLVAKYATLPQTGWTSCVAPP